MKRYGYKIIDETHIVSKHDFPKVSVQALLDTYGEDGWQVISFQTNSDCSNFTALLQRELSDDAE